MLESSGNEWGGVPLSHAPNPPHPITDSTAHSSRPRLQKARPEEEWGTELRALLLLFSLLRSTPHISPSSDQAGLQPGSQSKILHFPFEFPLSLFILIHPKLQDKLLIVPTLRMPLLCTEIGPNPTLLPFLNPFFLFNLKLAAVSHPQEWPCVSHGFALPCRVPCSII